MYYVIKVSTTFTFIFYCVKMFVVLGDEMMIKNIIFYNSMDHENGYIIDRERSKEITGYASIDKPWEKFYKKIPTKEIDLKQTVYEMVFNQDDMNTLALGFLGVDLTYKQLKEYTDQFADALIKNGVKSDDVVLMGVANSIETIISLLAINKIGAVSKWFDIRASKKDIEHYANSSNCKYMIAFDMLIPKINDAIKNTLLEKIIIVNPTSILPKFKQIIYKHKCKKEGTYFSIPENKEFISFNDFIKQGHKKTNTACAKYNEDKPAFMIQSSGTTGKPKTIVHSNLSTVSSVMQLAYSDLPFGKNKKILVALPPWIAYGLGNAIIMALSFGTKVELSPDFNPDAVYKNIDKFTISFAAPFHYRYLLDNFDKLTKKQKKCFEKIECMVTGGDKVTIEENKQFELTFGCSVVNGYGNNEGWGSLTVNPTKSNKYGTVGIPKPGDTIISYDESTHSENKYGEIGEICSLTKTKMLYYENNEEQTNRVKKQHPDGNIWLHTGDLGYIDEDGFIHLSGRTSRVITRLGFKISAYTIEDKITEYYAVKECVTVSVSDKDEEHVPMSFVVLKEEYKDSAEIIKNEIFDKCYMELKEYEIPKHIMIIEKMPYTQNNKYDFRLLEDMGNEYVSSLEKNNVKKLIRKNEQN